VCWTSRTSRTRTRTCHASSRRCESTHSNYTSNVISALISAFPSNLCCFVFCCTYVVVFALCEWFLLRSSRSRFVWFSLMNSHQYLFFVATRYYRYSYSHTTCCSHKCFILRFRNHGHTQS
jgi:hypothetical protein